MKKNILITGSTDGIGLSTAKALIAEGHQVYLHGRNKDKLKDVIQELKKATNSENISGFLADFSDLEQVIRMAKQVSEQIDSLDVLINNAGVWNSKQLDNEEGFDMRFVVNYLAPVALTNALLPLLRNSDDGRIINLSSAAQAPVSLQALKGEESLSTQEAYAQSKLALLMWSFDMARREKELTVIPVNPGSLLNTKMVQEVFGRHYAEADKGSRILHDLALNEKHKKHSGEYFDNDQGNYGRAHSDAYDQNKVNVLTEFTTQLLSN